MVKPNFVISNYLTILNHLSIDCSQPAYHSKKNEDGNPEACSCAICPLKTEFRGPAELAEAGEIHYDAADNRSKQSVLIIFSIPFQIKMTLLMKY